MKPVADVLGKYQGEFRPNRLTTVRFPVSTKLFRNQWNLKKYVLYLLILKKFTTPSTVQIYINRILFLKKTGESD